MQTDISYVECKKFSLQKHSSIISSLEIIFETSSKNSPSIVILDDLDSICSNKNEVILI